MCFFYLYLFVLDSLLLVFWSIISYIFDGFFCCFAVFLSFYSILCFFCFHARSCLLFINETWCVFIFLEQEGGPDHCRITWTWCGEVPKCNWYSWVYKMWWIYKILPQRIARSFFATVRLQITSSTTRHRVGPFSSKCFE